MALFSIAEQHVDGKYWYHPGQTYTSWEEANAAYLRIYSYLPRPYRVLKHERPFPQKASLYSWDCITWNSEPDVINFELN